MVEVRSTVAVRLASWSTWPLNSSTTARDATTSLTMSGMPQVAMAPPSAGHAPNAFAGKAPALNVVHRSALMAVGVTSSNTVTDVATFPASVIVKPVGSDTSSRLTPMDAAESPASTALPRPSCPRRFLPKHLIRLGAPTAPPDMTAHVAEPPAARYSTVPARSTAGGAPASAPEPAHAPELYVRGTVSPYAHTLASKRPANHSSSSHVG
mmetsp:Transcript_29166/g.72083  ORF Transcript_29166/g.72083 Transcript_29166/m.72083 type:complete len:210 (-) Transcript_29166:5891-6520(-)